MLTWAQVNFLSLKPPQLTSAVGFPGYSELVKLHNLPYATSPIQNFLNHISPPKKKPMMLLAATNTWVWRGKRQQSPAGWSTPGPEDPGGGVNSESPYCFSPWREARWDRVRRYPCHLGQAAQSPSVTRRTYWSTSEYFRRSELWEGCHKSDRLNHYDGEGKTSMSSGFTRNGGGGPHIPSHMDCQSCKMSHVPSMLSSPTTTLPL